jgi:Cu2+-exporting ATPase
MNKFTVTGMTCAACSARVEKAALSVDGVKSCSVNLLTGDMTADGGSPDEIISAVKLAGYGAALKGSPNETKADTEKEKENFCTQQPGDESVTHTQRLPLSSRQTPPSLSARFSGHTA